MSNFLEEYALILSSCERPSRYIGDEFLSANKDTYPLFKKGRVRANGNSYKIVGEWVTI